MPKPKPPEPKTKIYVDWNAYSKYLEEVHKEDFEKRYDALWRWFCGTSDFSNGCYVHMEPAETLGYDEDHVATWFANRIFEDYGKTEAVDKFGIIYLWVWW